MGPQRYSTGQINSIDKSKETTNFVVIVEQLARLLAVRVDHGDVIEVSECKQFQQVVGVGAGGQQLGGRLDVAHQNGHVERRHAERHLRVVHRATVPNVNTYTGNVTRQIFHTVVELWTGLSAEESIRMTEDRDKWRKYVHGVANPRIEDG